MKNKIALLGFILICELVGIAGSVLTVSSIQTWYATLVRPSFNPPNWIFGPVWTILYAMMGVAVFLVWQKGMKNKRVKFAVWFFMAHLLVNGIWTPIFFGLHNLALALFVISLMWLMIAYLVILFSKINKISSWLLVPYLFWVSFATVLNFSFWFLNR